MQTNLLRTFKFLRCPLCRKSFSLNGFSLLCESGHNFDISKNGYANLFNKPVQTKYDKTLFAARRNITEFGFFNPLAETILEILKDRQYGKQGLFIDCGCGEGSLFAKITANAGAQICALGIDISKDGINSAAGKFKDISWICADLAGIPLKDKSADVILNILSPANYSEFKRSAKDGAAILKVIPEEKYLQEIRTAFKKFKPESENVRNLFYENFKNVKEIRITKTQKIPQELKKDFLLMTPLLWNTDKEKESCAFGGELTLDLTVLYTVYSAL